MNFNFPTYVKIECEIECKIELRHDTALILVDFVGSTGTSLN